ncbi:MAG: hypothetical protein RLZZ600_223 [Actinomycetota bacterium]
MNRLIIILTGAIEALVVMLAGLAIPFVPVTVMWLSRLNDGINFDVYWRTAADTWLLGHGVHFEVTLDPKIAQAIKFPGADVPFLLALAPLAFGLLTFLLAARVGRRTIEAGTRFIGPISAISAFAGFNAIIVLLTRIPAVEPSVWRAFILPPAIFALGLIVGARGEIGRSGGSAERFTRWITGWAKGLPEHIRHVFNVGFRAAAGSLATLAGVSAVALAVLVIANFPRMVGLYEGLQAGAGGSFVLTLIEIMLMPNFVIWAMSWLTGAGFAIGVGSSVSPIGTALGPIPSLPMFGIIPTGEIPGGYMWVVIPIVIALVWAILMRRVLVVKFGGPYLGVWAFVTALIMTFSSALLAMGLAWIVSGAAGPGRLSLVGVVPWQIGLWVFGEVLVASSIGFLIPNRTSTKPVN